MSYVQKELGDEKEINSLSLMTWNLKGSMTGVNTKPNSKKSWLDGLEPLVCNNGDHQAQERQRKKSCGNGRSNDVHVWSLSAEQMAGLQTLVSILPSLLSQTTLDFVG
jgi:hypothetical protein